MNEWVIVHACLAVASYKAHSCHSQLGRGLCGNYTSFDLRVETAEMLLIFVLSLRQQQPVRIYINGHIHFITFTVIMLSLHTHMHHSIYE